jgi:hypothetical protein
MGYNSLTRLERVSHIIGKSSLSRWKRSAISEATGVFAPVRCTNMFRCEHLIGVASAWRGLADARELAPWVPALPTLHPNRCCIAQVLFQTEILGIPRIQRS